jgi:Tol biopolymer transport system component
MWEAPDSLAVCPAGDSVAAGHPARLRLVLRYLDAALAPRVGVPPESLEVTLVALADPGGLAIHDERVVAGEIVAWAEDSTDAAGEARFTVPSLSGSGRIAIALRVSDEEVGADTVVVHGCDTDLDGRVSGTDAAADLDYSGAADAADLALRAPHLDHWRRTALHGALVRRTSLCDTCGDGATNTLGESGAAWSPDGRRLAFTLFTGPTADCAVHLTPSDPAEGDALTQFTFPPAGVHDYDPDWSPLGTEIVFDRGDSTIYRKGVPGVAPDTSLHLVTHSDDGSIAHRGDVTPAISPDGRWVVFSRKGPEGYWHLWKIPIEGMEAGAQAIQLTAEAAGSDQYPRWSPDGAWIYYDRENGLAGRRRVFRVPAAGGTADSVLAPAGAWDATTPDLSPDGAVLLAGVGPDAFAYARTIERALPTQGTLEHTIPGHPEFGVNEDFPLLVPRFSPDGTRVALRASAPGHLDQRQQIWATRRSMSLPPAITALGGMPIAPATPYVEVGAIVGAPLELGVSASDPEGDPLTCVAYFLRPDLGMSFDSGTATFDWTPPASAADSTYTVRLQIMTPSGGTAYALARIHVTAETGVENEAPCAIALHPGVPNPFRDRATLAFDLPRAARARLEVFDPQGRRVALLVDSPLPAGRHAATWRARGGGARPTRAGIYLCRLTAGPLTAERKILLLP